MNRALGMIVAIVVVAAGAVALSVFYTVDQTQQALVVQFGEPKAVVTEPGLHVKQPWQTVVVFDRRVLNLDAPAEEVIAQDKKRLVVDAFARWKIVDPLRFYQALSNEAVARTRLVAILSSNVRRVLGAQSFTAVLSGERAKLMLDIRNNVNVETKTFGIEVVDVRIRRADLPEQNSLAIYRRMQQERVREANDFRAQGEEVSQRVRSRADRDVTVIRAEATRESEILRGQGDAEKNRIFADAYGKDPDFFAFYRSMLAYETTMKSADTTFVLTPDSEFFQYFGQESARSRR